MLKAFRRPIARVAQVTPGVIQAKVTILSLPAELLYIILGHPTNHTLLALALTCTGLHAISLKTLFTRNDICDPEKGWLVAYKAPPEILPAIHAALFIKQLSLVLWHFNPGPDLDVGFGATSSLRRDPESGWNFEELGMERVFGEVRDLRAIVDRLPELRVMKLQFSLVDGWLAEWKRGRVKTVDQARWGRSFIALLDAVLSKGCVELYVVGGGALTKAYTFDSNDKSLPVVPSKAGLGWQHISEADNRDRNRNRKTASHVSLSSPSKASMKDRVHTLFVSGKHIRNTNNVRQHEAFKLKTFHIHSDMLILPPFYSWTQSTLSISSSTLTSLSFKPQSTFMPAGFLLSLDLPNLWKFEVTSEPVVPGGGRVLFDDVSAFLEKHARLREVHLYGAELPTPIDMRKLSTSLSEPFLPRLVSINAHPAYIIWLLNQAISSESSWHIRMVGSLENLELIGITSENCIHLPELAYVLFDEALRAIVDFCGQRRSVFGFGRRRERDKKAEKIFQLALKFVSERGAGEWFASHLSSASAASQDAGSPSVLTRLTHVHTLTISGFLSFSLPRETIEILPEWLALVSSGFPGSSGSGSNSGQSSDPGPGDGKGSSAATPSAPPTPSRLKMVKFREHPTEVMRLLTAKKFVGRVAERCAALKWMDVEGQMFDLDKVRAVACGGDE